MCRDARRDINTVWLSAPSLDGKTDYIEGQSKRNNIIINSIPESQHESWEKTEDKVHCILAEKLEMDEEWIKVVRAHQTGDPTTQIDCQVFKMKDKAAVMARGNKPRDRNIYLKVETDNLSAPPLRA